MESRLNLPLFAYGGYSHTVSDQLPELNPELKQTPFKLPRRSDRLTQLSLLGVMKTAGCEQLPTNTQLVLASGDGNLSSTIVNNEQIFAYGATPNPIGFINTVNNSTAYHISLALGIDGQAMTVSRDYCSLEAGIQIAATLQQESLTPILLGTVDEAPMNLDQHRCRLNLPPETRLAEGSSWFLCGHSIQQQPPLARINYCGPVANLQALISLFRDRGITHYLYADGYLKSHTALETLPGKRVTPPNQGHFLTQNGQYLQHWLQTARPGEQLGMINQTQNSQRLSVTIVEKFGSSA